MHHHRYILYARKSSEDKSRQVSSIEDQVAELTKCAKNLNLNIVAVISESQSAKKPGRDGFNEMLQKIHNKEADAILCWKLDRLARNPIDQGTIAWMLQQGVIERIQTHSRYYEPKDNVLLMQMEFGMATQYIKDLNVNVSRGTRHKAERGWNPSPVLPMGYKHNPLYLANESSVEIVPDHNFPLIKQLWKLFLTGTYSVADIKRKGDALGVKGRRGNPIALNTYHLLLRKPFYAGYFMWKDEYGNAKEYKGKHTKMIHYDEFLKAQELLGEQKRTTKQRQGKYCFPFRGIMRCGSCTGYVTAQDIHQVICTHCKHKFSVKTSSVCKRCGMDYKRMENPSEVKKRYYRCNRKKDKKCKEKCIEEKDIMRCATKFAKEMTIDEDFYNWAVEELERQKATSPQEKILPSLHKRKRELNKRLDGLILMKADGEIDSEKYQAIYIDLNSQLKGVNQEIRKQEGFEDEQKQKALKHLKLAKNAYQSFLNASDLEKKHLFREIGYNLVLKGKSVRIITPKWISYLKEYTREIDAKKQWVQPKKSLSLYNDLGDVIPLNLNLLADRGLKNTCQDDNNLELFS